MILELKKFGKILNNRATGREAVLRARQIVNGEKDTPDDLVLDFSEVDIVTPSFADEFIAGLKAQYPQKQIKIRGAEGNPVLEEVLHLVKMDQDKMLMSKN